MADLLREQSSLSIGLSNISDEIAIHRKASRRARIYAHIDSAKKELKEEREKCIREFRKEVSKIHTRRIYSVTVPKRSTSVVLFRTLKI